MNPDFVGMLSALFEAGAEYLICGGLGRDDLLANKRAAARPKDLVDVSTLERE